VTWVNADRAQEIWNPHNKIEEDEIEEEDEEDEADASGDDDIDDDDDTEKEKTAKAEAAARDRVIAEIQRAKEAVATKVRAAQKEAKAILEDTPLVLPPAQPAQDEDLAAFEQFIDMRMMLTTKPGDKFNDSTARKKDIVAICEFLRGRLQKASHLQSVANSAKLWADKKENC
jgi:hypothetical protein